MTAAEAHQIVRGNAPAYEDNYFELFTDGSGHDATENSTGSAWTLRCVAIRSGDPGDDEDWRGACGSTHGTVQRAEFSALLAGLQQIAKLYGLLTLKDLQNFAGVPLKHFSEFPAARRMPVVWTSDRENLVLQVAKDRTGKPLYTRRGDMDLWAQLEFFESWINLTALHVPRNSQVDMEWADEAAGHVRDFFVIVRRNSLLENKPEIIAPEPGKRTTALYAIGEANEPDTFWYGPVNDINLVAATEGKSKESTIFKLTPKTIKPMFEWCCEAQVWKRIAT